MITQQICNHCEGKGYVEIRDCTGNIQREETCMMCGGTGKTEAEVSTSQVSSSTANQQLNE